MPTLVEHAGGQNVVPTLSTTPQSGDVAYIAILGNRATPRTVTSVSGLGATWSEVYNNGDSRVAVYKGTGATTSGSISVGLSGTQTTTYGAWLIRGLNNQAASGAVTTTASGTTLLGPSQSVGNGQVVCAITIVGVNPITWPVSQTPSGWTTNTNGTISGRGYRLPSTTESHQIEAGWPTSASAWVGQFIVGDVETASITGSLAATLPALTSSLSGGYVDPPPAGVFAAALPPLTSSITGGYEAPGVFAATLPALTADLAGTYDPPTAITGVVTATLPPLSGSLAGSYIAPISGTLTATLPSLTATLTGALFVDAQTDEADRANGRTRTGLAYAEVDPVLVELPTREPHRSMSQSVPAPTLDDGRPQ